MTVMVESDKDSRNDTERKTERHINNGSEYWSFFFFIIIIIILGYPYRYSYTYSSSFQFFPPYLLFLMKVFKTVYAYMFWLYGQ